MGRCAAVFESKIRGIAGVKGDISMSILEIKKLSFSYGNAHGKFQRNVLNDISLKVADSESVGLIGENGAGKSTFLKLLTGLLEIGDGMIRVAGFELKKENLKDIRAEIGYVFQDSDSQLFMSTVYEDVAS